MIAVNFWDTALIHSARIGDLGDIDKAVQRNDACIEARTGNPEDCAEEPAFADGAEGAFLTSGRTPLMEAVRQGHVDTAELLLNLGADVNALSGYNLNSKCGTSALHMAVTYPSFWSPKHLYIDR